MKTNTDIFLIKDQNGGFHRLHYSDILFVKSAGNYVKFVTVQGVTTTYGSLQSLKTFWEQDNRFLQIHRSFIVNLEKVDHISQLELTIGEYKIPIGSTFMEDLKNGFIRSYLLKL